MTPFALSLCLLIRVIMLRNNISASLLQFFNRFLNRIMFWCDILIRVKVGTGTGKVWSSLWTRKLDSSEAPARLRRFIGDTNFESIELRKAQKRSKVSRFYHMYCSSLVWSGWVLQCTKPNSISKIASKSWRWCWKLTFLNLKIKVSLKTSTTWIPHFTITFKLLWIPLPCFSCYTISIYFSTSSTDAHF